MAAKEPAEHAKGQARSTNDAGLSFLVSERNAFDAQEAAEPEVAEPPGDHQPEEFAKVLVAIDGYTGQPVVRDRVGVHRRNGGRPTWTSTLDAC